MWMECATGLYLGELAAGTSVELEAYVARPDLPFQFGAGYWEAGAEPESWREWTWVWAEPIIATGLGSLEPK